MTKEIARSAAQHAANIVRPLLNIGTEDGLLDLLNAVGWDGEALEIGDPAVFASSVQALADALDELTDLLELEDIGVLDLASTLAPLASAVTQVIQTVSSLTATSEVPADVFTYLGEDLVSFLVEQYMALCAPRLTALFEWLGICKQAELSEIKGIDGRILRREMLCRKIDLAVVSRAVSDPLAYLHQEFLLDRNGKRRAALEAADLSGPRLADTLIKVGLTAGYGMIPLPQPDPTWTQDELEAAKHLLIIDGSYPDPNQSGARTTLRVVVTLSDEPPPAGLSLAIITSGGLDVSFPLANGTLSLTLTGALDPLLINAHSVTLASGTGEAPQLAVEAQFVTDPAASPAVRFGSDSGTRFEIGQIGASLCLSTDSAGVDFGGALDLKGMLLAIQGGGGDGFLSKVLPQKPIELRADIGFDASLRKGLSLHGSAGLEFEVAINQSFLDTITVHSIYLALLAKEGLLEIDLAASLSVNLGPLSATVERIGLAAGLQFPGSGKFYPRIGFKPPTGIGLAVSGGGFEGGGFLNFDPDNGRYVGIMELTYQHTIALEAIGLLNTRLPGGGFSLLILISGEFPSIQLGYGFTLNGAGGLLGLNRSLNLDVLQEGIKSGALDAILFPQDPVANAAQIIGNLEAIFPTQPDHFVFGPMALIGWGTPTLITIELGLMLELPSPARLVILGALRCRLPSEDKEILRLQVGFIGAIDFSVQELSFDSSIYDSRLLSMTLSGDMALRLRWGSDPCFLLSVGGFHPKFQPPADLASMARITINILGSDNPRLKLEGYFAITSNTVQFGAKVELYAAACGFNVYGFLSFDVLLQFSPFYFIAEIKAGVAIRAGSCTLMGVLLEFALSGPTPWNARGKATFKILFFRFSVDFDKTFGERADTTFPPKDVWPLLSDALLDSGNWRAELPGRREPLVTLKKIPEVPGEVIVHPFGILSVSQKVVPLDLTISRFGNYRPAGQNRFSIVEVKAGGEDGLSMSPSEVRDEFARAQFEDMSDDERLALPSFEKLKSGVRLQASEALMPDNIVARKVEVDYKLSVIDVTDDGTIVPSEPGEYTVPRDDFETMIAGGSAAKSGLSILNDLQSLLGPASLYMRDDRYVVVSRADMQPLHGGLFEQFGSVFATYSEAFDILSSAQANNPDLNSTAQIVPACEVPEVA